MFMVVKYFPDKLFLYKFIIASRTTNFFDTLRTCFGGTELFFFSCNSGGGLGYTQTPI
jgi:hypothetical protein